MGLGSAISRTTEALVTTTTSVAGAVAGVTTTLAGAASGAALGGGVGALRGATQGAADGAGRGSRSTPAVVLTVAALGVTGVLDWPLLLAAGAAAYLLQRNSQGPDTAPTAVTGAGVKRRSAPATTPTTTPRRTPGAATAKPRKATRPASSGKSTSTS